MSRYACRVRTDNGLWLKICWSNRQNTATRHEWVADKAEATCWRFDPTYIVDWVLVADHLPPGAHDCHLDREYEEPAEAAPEF